MKVKFEMRAALVGLVLLLCLLQDVNASQYLRSLSSKDVKLQNGPERAFATRKALEIQRQITPIPRDLYIDKTTGLAYMKHPGIVTSTFNSSSTGNPIKKNSHNPDIFSLEPYGNYGQRKLRQQADMKGRRLRKDSTKPSISNLFPASNAVLNSTTFQVGATVTDNVQVSTVSVTLTNSATGISSTFSLLNVGVGSVWATTIQATAGATLRVTIKATDSSNNIATTSVTIRTSASNTTTSTATGTPINETRWTNRTAPISLAAGRIYFQMVDGTTGRWHAYVCSGTLVQLPSSSAATPDRSIVITAAHCVYDDVTKKFARNITFIPQQDDGGTDRSDRNCTNDALGCLTMDFGFVSSQYASRTFPNNIGADYGFYVTKSTVTEVKGKTIGTNGDIVPMLANFDTAAFGAWTYAMGYPYNRDPKFTYSYDTMGKDSSKALATNYWLKSCALGDGASGGPWTQGNPAEGVVSIMGTNSWRYVGALGVASSPLNTGGAACVYNSAVSTNLSTISGTGVVVSCNK